MTFSHIKFYKSFGFAFRGIRMALSNQQNLWIHLMVACIVVATGYFAKLSAIEWCIITLCIFMVIAMETMNSAIEKLVDFVSPGFHEQAGAIKDIAAAAVLLTVVGAVIIGMIIFLPKLI